jgi:sortase A
MKSSGQRRGGKGRIIVLILAILLLLSGLYLLALTLAPTYYANFLMKPIDVKTLPEPTAKDNRIIIPKIGVNIPYGTNGQASLDAGAEWRYPERGNPEKGGNFIIAAHRLTIKPTPQETVIKSPFYNIDKLAVDDKIIVDYSGKRYGYQIDKIFNVKPTDVYIEATTAEARLTLYTCELDGSDSGRVVVYAHPLGEVTVSAN